MLSCYHCADVMLSYCHASMLLSKVIAAEGEHKASRALRHAADVISENPAALQVIIFLDQSKNQIINIGFHKLFI